MPFPCPTAHWPYHTIGKRAIGGIFPVTVHGGLSPPTGKGAGPCFRLAFFS